MEEAALAKRAAAAAAGADKDASAGGAGVSSGSRKRRAPTKQASMADTMKSNLVEQMLECMMGGDFGSGGAQWCSVCTT